MITFFGCCTFQIPVGSIRQSCADPTVWETTAWFSPCFVAWSMRPFALYVKESHVGRFPTGTSSRRVTTGGLAHMDTVLLLFRLQLSPKGCGVDREKQSSSEHPIFIELTTGSAPIAIAHRLCLGCRGSYPNDRKAMCFPRRTTENMASTGSPVENPSPWLVLIPKVPRPHGDRTQYVLTFFAWHCCTGCRPQLPNSFVLFLLQSLQFTTSRSETYKHPHLQCILAIFKYKLLCNGRQCEDVLPAVVHVQDHSRCPSCEERSYCYKCHVKTL